ncbi:MAG: hypothetical protein IJK31_11115 [Ruminococcus sp.]|nr:hypothetical protein [Ruminococcus sp.]
MKKKFELSLLENADKQTVETLAEEYPAVTERERKQLWNAFSRRNCAEERSNFASRAYVYQSYKYRKSTSFAAMCAAIMLIVTGSIFTMKMLSKPDVAMNNSYSNIETAVVSGPDAAEPSTSKTDEQTKLILKMLNSIDCYDKASGRLVTKGNGNSFNDVEFEIDLTTARSYSHIRQYWIDSPESAMSGDYTKAELITDEYGTYDFINYSDGERLHSYNTYSKVHEVTDGVVSRTESYEIPDDERRYTKPDGTFSWRYRINPLNCDFAMSSLFPQIFVLDVLNDTEKWRIDGVQTYLDRECISVSSTNFTALIDEKTGVLMKYISTDENGEISDYICVQSVAFDDEATDVREIDISEWEGAE